MKRKTRQRVAGDWWLDGLVLGDCVKCSYGNLMSLII